MLKGGKMENIDKKNVKKMLLHLNEQLEESGEEVINLMKLVHYYEAFCLSVSFNIDKDVIENAREFAENICEDELDYLYTKQNTVTPIDLFNYEYFHSNKSWSIN